MLTSFDDYFIHQTPYPVLHPFTESENWTDRFYWNLHATNGAVMLGVGLGQYRTTGRMDSIGYLLHDGKQHRIKLGRTITPADFADPQIGPLRFDILEPLTSWRLRLDENPSGVAWDLTYTARHEPFEYQQFEFGNEEGKGSNYHHYVQHGRTTGKVWVGGQEIEFDELLTSRDRSWGVRRPREGQGLLLWLHHQFDSASICMILVEQRDGSISYFDGSVTDAEGRRALVDIGHSLRLDPETRDVLGGTVSVVDENGKTYRIDYVERLLRGYLGGIGYGGWQGQDRGEYFLETDVLDMSRPTAEIMATQPMHLFGHLMRATLNGAEETVADLEGGLSRSSKYNYAPRSVGHAGLS